MANNFIGGFATGILAGILVSWFVASLRMVIGRNKVRFAAIKDPSSFKLVYYGQLTVHEMTIKFSLSRRMTIINYLTLFPPTREPVTAEITFRYDGQTRCLYRGIWADTETIETVIQDECRKYLVVATYNDNKWFPVKETSGEPLPDSFTIEVLLRSERDGRPLGKPLQEEIISEHGILATPGKIIR